MNPRTSFRISNCVFALITCAFGGCGSTQQFFDIKPYLSRLEIGDTVEVRSELTTLLSQHPNSPEVLYLQAVLTTDGAEAVRLFQSVVDKYPNSDWADDALYKQAVLTIDRAGAVRLFQSVVDKYPNSDWADDALYKVYKLYQSIGLYRSAETKLEQMRRYYPHSEYLNDGISVPLSLTRALEQDDTLIRALEQDDTLFVQRILEKGADPNTAIQRVVESIFIAHSADQACIDLSKKYPALSMFTDNSVPMGMTSMMGVSDNMDVSIKISKNVTLARGATGELVYQLVVHGQSINARKVEVSYSLYPLMLARSAAMARLLCNHGVDIGKRDGIGMTAICRAAVRASNDPAAKDVLRYLTSKGADTDVEWLEFLVSQSDLGPVVIGFGNTGIKQLSHYDRIKQALTQGK
jgi:tetratricopeptide (TPR) repeat protein